MDYQCKIEKGLFAKNIVVGDINKAKYVFTAHYDTPPRLPKFFVKHMMGYSLLFATLLMGLMYAIPVATFELTKSIDLLNILSTATSIGTEATLVYSLLHVMGFAGNANKTNYNDNTSGCYTLLKLMEKYQNVPSEKRDQIAFVFFDNEEKFLLGSFTHRHKNRKIYKDKTYINFDCVALGDQINLYHFGKKPQIVKDFETEFQNSNSFIAKPQKSNMLSMSDHFVFRKTNHVCLLSVDHENQNSLFERIHSSNDNQINYENINNIIKAVGNLPFMSSLKSNKIKKLKHLTFDKNRTKQYEFDKTISRNIRSNENIELTK